MIHMAHMKLSTEQKQTHRHEEQACGFQGGWEGSGMDGEFGIGRCKFLHLKWLSNKVQHRVLDKIPLYRI